MNFKERAREEAKSTPIEPPEPGSHTFTLGQIFEQGFEKGAEWGMRQAAEILRKKPYEGSWTKVKEAGQMADWLLEKAGMD